MNDNKVIILVGYHKKSFLLKSDSLYPIQLGRKLEYTSSKDGFLDSNDYTWLHSSMNGDDTSENISDKNRNYSELTGIYWAWKNQKTLNNPDYIGFMHYRRQFCFDENLLKDILLKRGINIQSQNNLIFLNGINEFSENEISLLFSKDLINKSIQNYDIIAPCIKTEITQLEKFRTRNDLLVYSDIEKTIEIVSRLFPEYCDSLNSALNTHHNYLFNMFIMKKRIFDECCNFIFTTLFELEKFISYEGRNANQKRLFGYVSEVLFTAFFIKKTQEHYLINNLKIMFEANYSNDDSFKSKFTPDDIPQCLVDTAKSVKQIADADETKKIYIYGAGELCEKLLFCFDKEQIVVSGIFDRVPGKRFGFYVENISKDKVNDNDIIVIASQAYSSEIEKRITDVMEEKKVTIVKINDYQGN